MTDKHKQLLTALSPLTSALLFGFFIYASREFILSVRADQADHSQQIREIQLVLGEKSVQLKFIENEMRELKDTMHRVEQKLDELKR